MPEFAGFILADMPEWAIGLPQTQTKFISKAKAMRKTHLINGCKTATRNAMAIAAVGFDEFCQLPDAARCEKCDACGQVKLEMKRLAGDADQWIPEVGDAADAWKSEVKADR